MKIDAEAWYTGLGQVALAFFGGLIGALMRREASNWQTASLAACGAGFVGFLVAKFCKATGVSEDLTFAFVGVAGWLGAARTIDYFERLLEARIGVRLPRARHAPPAEPETNANSKVTDTPSTVQDGDVPKDKP